MRTRSVCTEGEQIVMMSDVNLCPCDPYPSGGISVWSAHSSTQARKMRSIAITEGIASQKCARPRLLGCAMDISLVAITFINSRKLNSSVPDTFSCF